jgi:YfiH family protein
LSAPDAGWIRPDWPVAARVRALITTRQGGVSRGPYGAGVDGGGMNLGLGSGDDAAAVAANRARLLAVLPAAPRWLRQVHGGVVVRADDVGAPVEADAAFTCTPGVVAAVMVADCLPVLLADRGGRCVAAAHAGWRGVAAGVIQSTVRAMRDALGEADAELVAYLGPAIGPAHFEVGPEVLAAMSALPDARKAFRPRGAKYFADLYGLARQALRQADVRAIHGGSDCTFTDAARFYSHRRDRVTGRHGALVWIEPASSGVSDDGQPRDNRV